MRREQLKQEKSNSPDDTFFSHMPALFCLDTAACCRCNERAQLFATGQCGCLDYDLTQGDDWETIYNAMGFDAIISEYDNDTKRAVIKTVCNSSIYLGEHMHVSCVPYRSKEHLIILQELAYIRVSQCSIDHPTT